MGVIKGTGPRRGVNPSESEELANLELITNELLHSDGDESVHENNEEQESNVVALLQAQTNVVASRRLNARNILKSRIPVPEDTFPLRSARFTKKQGSRKIRRLENQNQLLRERDEELREISIEDFVPNYAARAFSRFLLQGQEMMEIWSQFINPDEEEDGNENDESEEENADKDNDKNTKIEVSAEEAFSKICRNLRSWLKSRHLPLGMMEDLEETLLCFFQTKPQDIFVSAPLNSFQRGMLHALSQYNNLRSQSLKCKNYNGKKCPVRVQNLVCQFCPPPISLVQFIENKLHNDDEE